MSKKYLINDDPVVSKFIEGVRQKLKSRLKNVYLFGSRARGDAWEGSDYYIALVVKDRDQNLEDMVLDISTFLLDQFEVLISTHIFTEEEWLLEKKLPLGINILKEGIAL
jgi:predicted nucleotidyltransferase